MSAHIVSRETLNRVVMSMTGESTCSCEEMDQLGNRLWAMNGRAVADRYAHHDKVDEAPDDFSVRLNWNYSIFEKLKAVDCLIYQCTEGKVPDESLYKTLVDHRDSLARQIIHEMAEYKAAPWDWNHTEPKNDPQTMPLRRPETAKDGFINLLSMAFNQMLHGHKQEALHLLSDAIDTLSSSRTKFEYEKSEPSSPVPSYDPAEDGDYSLWLARNNID